METLERFPFSIKNNILIGEQVDTENENINIGELILNTLKSQPNFVTQVDVTIGKEITFQEIRNRSVKLAIWMKLSGICPGDHIGVSSNHHAVMYIFFACLFIGAIPTIWHDRSTTETSEFIIKDAKRKMIFIDDLFATSYYDFLSGLLYKPIIVVLGIFTAFISYDDLESRLDKDFDQEAVDKFTCLQTESKRNIATIMYTRGVSDLVNKPVIVPHTTFMATVNRQVFDMLPTGTGMWVGPFSSLINMQLAVYSILSFKRTIRFKTMGCTKEQICQTLEKHKVDWVLLETYMCRDIVNFNLFNRHDLSSLKMLIFTGSPISYDLHRCLTKSLPNTSIVSLYSTTETGIISCRIEDKKLISSGYVGKNICVKIVDLNSKKTLGPYRNGEICFKSKDIMHQYYKYNGNNVALFDNELIINDEWYYTEDIGYFDEDGDLFVIERVADIIRFKEFRISPTIIENIISRNSDVEAVVVIGLTVQINCEHLTAYVSMKPGKKLNTQEVQNEIKDKLYDHMKLRGGVKVVLDLPYSLSGDIDRGELREEMHLHRSTRLVPNSQILPIEQVLSTLF